jgi:hypothetical protein
VFTGTSDGRLLAHDGLTYSPLGEARLPGPASHLLLDPERGVLYAAIGMAEKITLSRFGMHEQPPSNILSFDVKAVLGGGKLDGVLQGSPVQSLGLPILSLALSRDGRKLYALHDTGRGPRVTVTSVEDRKDLASKTLPGGGPTFMALCPDEDQVVLLAAGRLALFSSDLDLVHSMALVGGSVSSPCPIGGGRLLLLDRRQGDQLICVDMMSRAITARYDLPRFGRWHLRPTRSGSRVVLALPGVLQGKVWVINTAPTLSLAGIAQSTEESLIRGVSHVSDDGSVLILSNGEVYRKG